MNVLENKLVTRLMIVVCALFLWSIGARGALGGDPAIQVDWDEPGDPPELDADYFVTTEPPASPEFPDVRLETGSLTWRIWSTDAANPDNIGDIGVISSPHAENFGVRILDDQEGPGARTVKAIILDPQGQDSDEDYSNLVDGMITGDLVTYLAKHVVSRISPTEGRLCTLVVRSRHPKKIPKNLERAPPQLR